VAGWLVDEPIDLPDDSEVDLIVVDQGDDLDDMGGTGCAAWPRHRTRLERGEGIPAEQVIEEVAAAPVVRRRYHVIVAPRAAGQLERITDWWRSIGPERPISLPTSLVLRSRG
jgi:hypothetical protein